MMIGYADEAENFGNASFSWLDQWLSSYHQLLVLVANLCDYLDNR